MLCRKGEGCCLPGRLPVVLETVRSNSLFNLFSLCYVWISRVHISQSTMECLHDEFDVEPGNGGDRCDYLKERGIETYLVIVPKGPLGKNGISGVVS